MTYIRVNTGFLVPPPDVEAVTVVRAYCVRGALVLLTLHLVQGAILLHPESTGTISLKSASIWDKPIIDARYEQPHFAVCCLRLVPFEVDICSLRTMSMC